MPLSKAANGIQPSSTDDSAQRLKSMMSKSLFSHITIGLPLADSLPSLHLLMVGWLISVEPHCENLLFGQGFMLIQTWWVTLEKNVCVPLRAFSRCLYKVKAETPRAVKCSVNHSTAVFHKMHLDACGHEQNNEDCLCVFEKRFCYLC